MVADLQNGWICAIMWMSVNFPTIAKVSFLNHSQGFEGFIFFPNAI